MGIPEATKAILLLNKMKIRFSLLVNSFQKIILHLRTLKTLRSTVLPGCLYRWFVTRETGRLFSATKIRNSFLLTMSNLRFMSVRLIR
jgi:hypothetical protein